MNKKVRVRFAPSPTGPLHIGGVRTALYNYLFAKKNKGTFILRIEDTDQSRFIPGTEDYIIESLNWLGIKPDEGIPVGGLYSPYRQSERKHIYKEYIDLLISKGHAYYAFDTPEELEAMRKHLKEKNSKSQQYDSTTRILMKNSLTLSKEEVEKRLDSGENYVVRIKIEPDKEVSFYDIIRGNITVNTNNIDDKVLFKSDGMPTYHFANVVDDCLMQISHVIRGEEWLPSTPLHVLLYKYLGWEKKMPQFAHLPLLLRPDGNGKLSKRDGDRLGFPVYPIDWYDPNSGEVFSGYRESGYLPEAVVNMLAFLGWNPGDDRELLSMDELINEFSLERVVKHGAKFDLEKAKWYNQQYIRMRSNSELAEMLENYLLNKVSEIKYSREKLIRIVEILKERVTFVKDFYELGYYFFFSPKEYDVNWLKKKWKTNSLDILNDFYKKVYNIEPYEEKNIEECLNDFIKEKNITNGEILPILRIVLTGRSVGPSSAALMEVIGKEEFKNRIEKFEKMKLWD